MSSSFSFSTSVPPKKVTRTTTTTAMTSRRRRRRRNGLWRTEDDDDDDHHHHHHRSFKGEKEHYYSSDAHSRGKPNASEPYRFSGADGEEDHVFDSRMAKELALDVVEERVILGMLEKILLV